MKTPFSAGNANFSDKCHSIAQHTIYKSLFPDLKIDFVPTTIGSDNLQGDILDGTMAVDRCVKVYSRKLNQINLPLEFFVQERFRRFEFHRYRDLTITEWNSQSRKPSELYKLKAGLFVYGYLNQAGNDFTEAIVVETSGMLLSIIQSKINYSTRTNPRSGQSFIGLKFDDLINCGLVYLHYFETNQ
jgi:hypothetical protein